MSSVDLISKRHSNISQKSSVHIKTLSHADRVGFGAVLEDCVDQLAVLGGIMPDFNEKPSAAEEILGAELSQILEAQRMRSEGTGTTNVTRESNKEQVHAIFTAAAAAKNTNTVTSNMEKLEEDRHFLQEVLSSALEEVQARGTYTSLSRSLQLYRDEKEQMRQIIRQEEECRKRMKQLKKELSRVKKEKEREIADLDEKVAYLKDELQENKAETELMSKLTLKETELDVESVKRKSTISEQTLAEDISRLQQKTQEEKMVNAELCAYLKKHCDDMEVKVEEWMTKYEEETESKSKELQILETAKQSNVQELQELAEKYQECDKVVGEYNEVKRKARELEEEHKRRNKAAIKLQACYRGYRVRHKLGPYAPPKDKKKKGKGKGKGKGKKKK